MIEIKILVSMLSLGLLFVLFVTGAYTRSISTSIYIISFALSMECYTLCFKDTAFIIIGVGAIVALARAVINTERDSFIKRKRKCLDM